MYSNATKMTSCGREILRQMQFFERKLEVSTIFAALISNFYIVADVKVIEDYHFT